MKNLYKIQDELYIVSDKEKSSYCIKECPMVGLNIDRCDCQIFTTCSNKVGNIILTTNKLLIKDDVQAIDDTFLEWFCSKNGEVDFVEVKKGFEDGSAYGYNFLDYKIIIPSEEPTFVDKLKEYFENTSEEKIQKDWDEACEKTKGINSPTVEEFLEAQKQNLIDMMQDDEKLGLYDYGWCKGNVVLPNEENCCTPIGQIKRYKDCIGCDKKPNKLDLTQLSKDVDDVLDKETKESMSQWLKEKKTTRNNENRSKTQTRNRT